MSESKATSPATEGVSDRERWARMCEGVVARLERAAIAAQHPQNAHISRDFESEASDWRAIAAALREQDGERHHKQEKDGQ